MGLNDQLAEEIHNRTRVYKDLEHAEHERDAAKKQVVNLLEENRLLRAKQLMTQAALDQAQRPRR